MAKTALGPQSQAIAHTEAQAERQHDEESRYTVHMIPHTHWDREWYQPFQVFRARLVDVIDRIMDILEHDSTYRSFTLDGQAVVLEDYLEIRPENRGRIRALVQAGRLHIGPWYVLADEFLVSPEALIRNLMLGRRVCQEFGEPMTVAYTPDSFGHISQLPLLVTGFGLDSIVFQRGVGDEGERLKGEFRWLAADGTTEVFAVHLLGTYSAAAAIGHTDWEFGDSYRPEFAIRQARALLTGNAADLSHLPGWFRESIQRLAQGLIDYASNGVIILLNGSDHLYPQDNLPQVIQDLNAAFVDTTFIHSDIASFVDAARQPLDQLESYRGEFRGSRYQHILSGVLSARMYLKQVNHHAEMLLERYAEPLATMAWLQRFSYPGALLWQAWKLLLKNHPHDSICGCSVDAVHREMMTRYESVTQLGTDIASRAVVDLSEKSGHEAITVFNPLPYPQQTVIEATVDLPAGQGLCVHDESGRLVPCHVTVEEVLARGRSDERLDRTTVLFLGDLAPLSLSGYEASRTEARPVTTDLWASQRSIENRFLRLELNGRRLELTDKSSGLSYPLNLRLEDIADAGDEYDFSPLPDDKPLFFALTENPPELLTSGTIRATWCFAGTALLPAGLSRDRQGREETAALPWRLELSLEAGSSLVKLGLHLTNRAQDHRLRLRVFTSCHADEVWAGGHFDVLKRPARPPIGADWFQKPQATNHHRHFVLAADNERGLAVFNRGLPEYEAIPSATGTDLALTLLRCVGWLSREDLLSRPQGAGPSLATPEAQCLSEHSFELGLYPFAGSWWDSELVQLSQSFVAPPETYVGLKPVQSLSWLELTPPLCLSSFKRAEQRDSLIVRIWNPTPVQVIGTLRLLQSPSEAFTVNLAEERERRLTLEGNSLALQLSPKRVLSFEFVFGRAGEAMT